MYSVVLAATLLAGGTQGWNDDWNGGYGWCGGYNGYIRYGCRGYGCSGCYGYGSGYYPNTGWNGYGGYYGAGYGGYGSFGTMGSSGTWGTYGSYANTGNGGFGCGGFGYGYPAPIPAPLPPPPIPGYGSGFPGYGPPRGINVYPMGGAPNVPTIVRPIVPEDAARITIHLPENCRLFVNNQFASDFGPPVRYFATPSLRPGTEYYYSMRIEAVDGAGRVTSETRQVLIRAGQHLTVNFLQPNGARLVQGF